MFDNIGGKIKALVKIVFTLAVIVGIIGSIIVGVTLYKTGLNGLLVLLIVIIAFGLALLFAWISCFFMYGFGELVESSAKIAENTEFLRREYKSPSSAVRPASSTTKKESEKNKDTWECQYCGYENPNITSFCRNCQKSRY